MLELWRKWVSGHVTGWVRGSIPKRPYGPGRKARLGVEILEARITPNNTIWVTTDADNATDPVVNSLRWAINKANADEGDDVIKFLFGGGERVLFIKDQPLPVITSKVTIDATPPPLNDSQVIVITPHLVNVLQGPATDKDGLRFQAGSSGSKVLGLTIRDFNEDGIEIHQASNITIGGAGAKDGNTITGNKFGIFISTPAAQDISIFGNFIGTNSQSAANLGNKRDGILISGGPQNVQIGSISEAERNIISGNLENGIRIRNASYNFIRGNYIGTNKDGTAPLANKQSGIVIEGHNSIVNTIGTVMQIDPRTGVITSPANVISGNDGHGIYLRPESDEAEFGPSFTKIVGNFIGTAVNGTSAVANKNMGISIGASWSNTIGTRAKGEANLISGNTAQGILVGGNAQFNRIENNFVGTGKDPSNNNVKLPNGNAAIEFTELTSKNTAVGNIVKNHEEPQIRDQPKKNFTEKNTTSRNGAPGNGLGIDIGVVGVTMDNMPTLTSAAVNGLTTNFVGNLTNATPNSTFVVEFFGNSVLHPSGYGEGERYLGEITVTTDANGYAEFDVMLEGVFGSYVSATATLAGVDGFTSEFSQAIALSGASSYAAVGSLVWDDFDQNGLQDVGELGVAGVTVELYTATGTFVLSTTTDVDGKYSFTDRSPGDYYLRFIAPANYSFTLPYQGFWVADSNAEVGTGRTEVFTLIAGEYNPDLDAGLLYTPTGVATIQGRAFNDANGDGIQNVGETGLAGVTVRLYRHDGVLLASVLTASNGTYEFTNLAPGSYYLVFERPPLSSYEFSPQDQGSDDTLDSDADEEGVTALFTLLGGQIKDDLDAGLFGPVITPPPPP